MTETTINHKLTAVLYADVVGYSRLTRQDEIGTHRQVMSVLDYASATIKNNDGVVLRYAGDAILAEFQSMVAATMAAVSIQNELFARNLDEEDKEEVGAIHPGASVKTWEGCIELIQDHARREGLNSELPDFYSDLFNRAIASGYGEEDVASIVKVLRENA